MSRRWVRARVVSSPLPSSLHFFACQVLKAEGYDFMHNDHHGYILTCPSNLGTGLRASAMMKVPLFSSRPEFKEVCKKLGLQVSLGSCPS